MFSFSVPDVYLDTLLLPLEMIGRDEQVTLVLKDGINIRHLDIPRYTMVIANLDFLSLYLNRRRSITVDNGALLKVLKAVARLKPYSVNFTINKGNLIIELDGSSLDMRVRHTIPLVDADNYCRKTPRGQLICSFEIYTLDLNSMLKHMPKPRERSIVIKLNEDDVEFRLADEDNEDTYILPMHVWKRKRKRIQFKYRGERLINKLKPIARRYREIGMVTFKIHRKGILKIEFEKGYDAKIETYIAPQID